MSVQLFGTLFAADTDTRTLSYHLLPYEEYGSTSLGLVKAAPGVITLPEDLADLQFNLEHDRRQPVGTFAALTDTDTGLDCEVSILATSAGNDLLVEAAAGVRSGISIELDDVTINEQGELTAGRLVGAGAVVNPAFPSARLAAAYTEPTTKKDEPPMPPKITQPVPAALTGGAKPVTPFPSLLAAAISTQDQGLLAKLSMQATGTDLFAAAVPLADVPAPLQNDHQAQWIGELWKARQSYGILWNRFTNQDLTDLWVQGFDNPITNELKLADYTGAPSTLPTITPPTVTPFNEQAKRAAVGFNYDRAAIDFGKTQFIESYIQSGFNYWDRLLDLVVASLVTANATALAAKEPRTDVDPAITEIVSGMQALTRKGAIPNIIVLGEDKAYGVATAKDRDKLASLSISMGIAEGTAESATIIDGSGLGIPASSVFIADSRALAVYTLPGAPIRVNALSLATGQVSEALHGYHYERLHDAKAILKVTPYVAA